MSVRDSLYFFHHVLSQCAVILLFSSRNSAICFLHSFCRILHFIQFFSSSINSSKIHTINRLKCERCHQKIIEKRMNKKATSERERETKTKAFEVQRWNVKSVKEIYCSLFVCVHSSMWWYNSHLCGIHHRWKRNRTTHTHTHTHTIGVVCAFEAQIRREERPKDARTRKTIHTNFIVCFVRFFLFDSMHAMILIEWNKLNSLLKHHSCTDY